MTAAHRLALAGILSLAASAGPAGAADDKDAVMVPITQFIMAMDMGDETSAALNFAPSVTILDSVPPHHWAGPTAVADWWADFGKDAGARGVTEPAMTLRPPTIVTLSGDHAYVVTPGTYAFKLNGKAQSGKGTMTFALDRAAGGWRIAAWAWAGK